MGERYIDLTGKRFGRLVATKKTGVDRFGKTRWDCLCDCGNKVNVTYGRLVYGETLSCKCLNNELLSKRRYKHGLTGSPTYVTWINMRNRCNKKTDKRYHRYGGRGIRVCDRWVNSFESFLEDMGEKPVGKELDRIDNNGDYCKGNCHWVAQSENSLNTSRSKLWVLFGEEFQSAKLAAKKFNVSPATIQHWCDGWTNTKGIKYEPKPNCYSKRKYKESE